MGRVSRTLYRFEASEVKTILKRGKRVLKTPTCDIIVTPKAHENGRILVITPKRIGKASQRNKVRRRIKALFYEQKFYVRGVDCLAIIKKEGIDTPFDELVAIFKASFEKI
jgi:ribonuclease P protein component